MECETCGRPIRDGEEAVTLRSITVEGPEGDRTEPGSNAYSIRRTDEIRRVHHTECFPVGIRPVAPPYRTHHTRVSATGTVHIFRDAPNYASVDEHTSLCGLVTLSEAERGPSDHGLHSSHQSLVAAATCRSCLHAYPWPTDADTDAE